LCHSVQGGQGKQGWRNCIAILLTVSSPSFANVDQPLYLVSTNLNIQLVMMKKEKANVTKLFGV
jgi:hypothetical protein